MKRLAYILMCWITNYNASLGLSTVALKYVCWKEPWHHGITAVQKNRPTLETFVATRGFWTTALQFLISLLPISFSSCKHFQCELHFLNIISFQFSTNLTFNAQLYQLNFFHSLFQFNFFRYTGLTFQLIIPS